MSFNIALTSGQLESLRGTTSVPQSHRARICISACPNTNIYTCQVNQTTFGASVAMLAVDGGVGTIGNVRPGMVVLISHTNDRRKAYLTGRIRKAPSLPSIYINEASAPFANNDYVFIVDDYRILDRLPRYVSATEKPDYEIPFRQLQPRITDLKSGYADEATSSILTLSFAPTVTAATSGATISSYLWEVADGTITVGSSTTKNITATFPPGFRWIHFSSTDSGGRTAIRHIPVWSHDDTYPVQVLDHGDLSVSASVDEGYSGSVTAWDGIDTLLDNTLIVAWLANEQYNDVATHIDSNIVLVGRLRSESSSTSYEDHQIDAQTEFQIEGPLQQLARLEITSQQLDNKNSPTKFNQIKNLTLWREVWLILTEYSTFAELHSVDFSDTTDNFQEKGIVCQAGDQLSVVNALANGIGAAIEMNASGEAMVARDGVMLPTASRSALVTVAGWSSIDWTGIPNLDHDHVNTVGKLDASGGTYNSTSGYVTTAQSIAPGIAQDYPSGTASLNNQILAINQKLAAAETELNIRAGHAYAKAQGADEITINHPDGYWFLIPSKFQWFTLTLDGSETARGYTCDTSIRWQLVSITVTHEVETGTRTVEAVYRRETSGAPGQAVRIPPQTSKPPTLPSYPPLPSFEGLALPPFLPETLAPMTYGPNIRRDGNMVMYGTTLGAWIATDFLTKLTPAIIEITPPLGPNETVIAGRFIPTSNPGAYLVTAGTWEVDIDLTLSDGGFVPEIVGGNDRAVYVPGVGWQAVDDIGGTYRVCNIIFNMTATTVLFAEYTYDADNGDNDIGANRTMGIPYGTLRDQDLGAEGTDLTLSYTGFIVGAPTFSIGGVTGTDTPPTGQITIKRFVARGLGTNPFPFGTGQGARLWYRSEVFNTSIDWTGNDLPTSQPALMRIGETYDDVYVQDALTNDVFYSADKGATWSAAINVGTPAASPTGFDTQRLGTASLGGADGLVRIATTQGGSYADYTTYLAGARPTAIYIPRYKFAAGANNGIGVSAPDYLTASLVSDVAGHSVWTVESGGISITQVDPVDGGSHGAAVGPNCLHIPWYPTAYHDFLAVLDFGGTRKLAVSTDGGITWVFSGALHASSAFLTTRRTDSTRRQAFICNGPDMVYVSDYRASPPVMATRTGPSGDNLIFVDVLS